MHHKLCYKLAGANRNECAEIRARQLFTSDEINRRSLELVESAMFLAWVFPDDKPSELSKRAKIALQATADFRYWFDKCLNVVVLGRRQLRNQLRAHVGVHALQGRARVHL